MKKPPQERITIAQPKIKWNPSEEQKKQFCEAFIKERLSTVNLLAGGRYYVMDYEKKRFIVDSSSSSFLCGHPIELLEKNQKDFGFFNLILSKKDWNWLSAVNKAAYAIFSATPLKNRNGMVISYDLAFITANNKKIILHHKVVPYELCQNGNLWLSLCSVAESIREESQWASIINTETGEYYRFNGTTFIKSSYNITEKDVELLRCLAKGLTADDTCKALGVTEGAMKRRKRLLYKKIGVHNAPEAVRWAHLEGFL